MFKWEGELGSGVREREEKKRIEGNNGNKPFINEGKKGRREERGLGKKREESRYIMYR